MASDDTDDTDLPSAAPAGPAPATGAAAASAELPFDDVDWDAIERVIVLSPHLDDAALSCGGLLTSLHRKVSRLVVTISCGDARGRGRKGVATPAQRRLEDRRALHSIDCDFAHLGFVDAIYRRSPFSGQLIYHGIRERMSAPPIDDGGHVEELYLVLRRLCGDMGNVLVLSPMAVGQHVDHVLCAHVAMRLFGSSPNLLFYEDFPYVLGGVLTDVPDDGPETAMRRLDRIPVRRYAVPIDPERKIALFRHYASQIPPLFGTDERMCALVRGHAEGGHATEGYWRSRPNRSRGGRGGGDGQPNRGRKSQ
jgi:LmbE family N-acetylglucosaminyl deacetylase